MAVLHTHPWHVDQNRSMMVLWIAGSESGKWKLPTSHRKGSRIQHYLPDHHPSARFQGWLVAEKPDGSSICRESVVLPQPGAPSKRMGRRLKRGSCLGVRKLFHEQTSTKGQFIFDVVRKPCLKPNGKPIEQSIDPVIAQPHAPEQGLHSPCMARRLFFIPAFVYRV